MSIIVPMCRRAISIERAQVELENVFLAAASKSRTTPAFGLNLQIGPRKVRLEPSSIAPVSDEDPMSRRLA